MTSVWVRTAAGIRDGHLAPALIDSPTSPPPSSCQPCSQQAGFACVGSAAGDWLSQHGLSSPRGAAYPSRAGSAVEGDAFGSDAKFSDCAGRCRWRAS